MSLDLGRTALQIDEMASELSSRQTEGHLRIQKALAAVGSFDLAANQRKRLESKGTMAWSVPGIPDDPGARYSPPPTPDDFSVVGADGSHIDVDRHLPARCYLINTGVAALTYGSRPDARLDSEPRLYAGADDLVLRDAGLRHREQVIEGTVLGAKRTVEEIKALVSAVRQVPPELPTLAIMDGSLIMLGLIGRGYDDFVRDRLIGEGFVAALDELKAMAADRPLVVASYISLPRSAEVVNALRLELCPYEVARCDQFCAALGPGQRPCDAGTMDVRDREVYAEVLEPGERSAVFESPSPLVESYYRDHGLFFFYVNVGAEIGRVEVPSWVARDEASLGLTHSLIVDQCRRGPGYPVALTEAHEQAVVTGADRRYFTELVENALNGRNLPVHNSEKSRAKRLRRL